MHCEEYAYHSIMKRINYEITPRNCANSGLKFVSNYMVNYGGITDFADQEWIKNKILGSPEKTKTYIAMNGTVIGVYDIDR